MTPAERLLAAADLLDKRANEATGGPWRYNPNKHTRLPGTTYFEEAVFAGGAGKAATTIAATGLTDDPPSMADARYIATMHPEVGKQQATLLRAMAHLGSERPEVTAYFVYSDAVALADLVLGTP